MKHTVRSEIRQQRIDYDVNVEDRESPTRALRKCALGDWCLQKLM